MFKLLILIHLTRNPEIISKNMHTLLIAISFYRAIKNSIIDNSKQKASNNCLQYLYMI